MSTSLDHGAAFEGSAAIRELAAMRATMAALLAATRYETLQTIVGNFDYRESVLKDSPGAGSRRLIVPRYGTGSDNLSTAALTTTPTEIVEKNEGRLGGLIVNYGANGCFLYLATLGDVQQAGQRSQRAATWLGPGGGAWDFRLGNVLYGGTVVAAAQAATTTLTIAEF